MHRPNLKLVIVPEQEIGVGLEVDALGHHENAAHITEGRRLRRQLGEEGGEFEFVGVIGANSTKLTDSAHPDRAIGANVHGANKDAAGDRNIAPINSVVSDDFVIGPKVHDPVGPFLGCPDLVVRGVIAGGETSNTGEATFLGERGAIRGRDFYAAEVAQEQRQAG